MEFSVVIPVYRGEKTLPELVARLAAIGTRAARYEIILVNDASPDDSWRVIRALAEQNPAVRGINLIRNFGQHNALLAGIRAARYDTIVTMDDDLQHPPEEIPSLLAKVQEGYDVVYGTPIVKRDRLYRIFFANATRFILRTTTGIKIATQGSSFRAFRAELRGAFADYQNPFVLIDVLLSWGADRYASVPVQHEARAVGKSNYSFFKLAILALDITTGFSTWPLRLATLIGFLFTLAGMSVFLYTLIAWLIEGGIIPPLRVTGSLIAIFSGAQLFALGIMGEYLARMHFRLMQRPAYVIREQTEQDESTRT